MTTSILRAALAGAALFLAAGSASAATPDRDEFRSPEASTKVQVLILAKHGADDGANHDVGDDRGRRGKKGGKGRGGADDGPNHT